MGVYRVPVSLLRTISKVDLAGKISSPENAAAAHWLSVMKVASFRFDGQQISADERYAELLQQTQKEFAVSDEFDLAPESCTTLIKRQADAA
jgi:hypothetical protein